MRCPEMPNLSSLARYQSDTILDAAPERFRDDSPRHKSASRQNRIEVVAPNVSDPHRGRIPNMGTPVKAISQSHAVAQTGPLANCNSHHSPSQLHIRNYFRNPAFGCG